MQLTPPKPEIPADFHLKYDMEYWGHNTSNHSIFGTYGNVLKPSIDEYSSTYLVAVSFKMRWYANRFFFGSRQPPCTTP